MASATWLVPGSGPSTEARRDPGSPTLGVRNSGRGQTRTEAEKAPADRGRIPRGNPTGPAGDEGRDGGPLEGGAEVRAVARQAGGQNRTGPAEDQGPHESRLGTEGVGPAKALRARRHPGSWAGSRTGRPSSKGPRRPSGPASDAASTLVGPSRSRARDLPMPRLS